MLTPCSLFLFMKNANEEEIIYRKIGERYRQHPELLMESGQDRQLKIRNLVVSGAYAYIGVRLSYENNLNLISTVIFVLFIKAESSIKYIMEEDYFETKQCRMTPAKTKYHDASAGFVLPKNSPLTKIFNKKYSITTCILIVINPMCISGPVRMHALLVPFLPSNSVGI